MHKCRWIGAASLLMLVMGCASHHHGGAPVPKDVPIPPGGPVVPAGPPVSPAGRPDQMDTGAMQPGSATPADTSASNAQMLASRTAAYSKQMEAAVQRQAQTAAPTKAPSQTPPPQQQATASDASKPLDARLAAARSDPPPSAPGSGSQVQWGTPADRRVAAVPDATPVDTSQAQIASMQSTPAVANLSTSVNPRVSDSTSDVRSTELGSLPPPTRTAPAAMPVSPSSDGMTVTQTESLTQRLATRVHDYPHDLSAQFDYELSRFITDQSVPDLNSLAALPSEDSEMMAALMDGLSNFRNNLRADANMLMPEKVAPLLAAADRLKARAGLNIPTVKLCTSVSGFGNYKPLAGGDAPHFQAGVESKAILYCEVNNFSSQQMPDKEWRTELAQTVVLYSDQGVPEWRDNRQTVSDLARSHRHDFFVVQKLTFSPNLAAGQYLLKVTVEDTQAQRFSEASLPVSIDIPQHAPPDNQAAPTAMN